MTFLEGLKLGAFCAKAKLKATNKNERWAKIEFALVLAQKKSERLPQSAGVDEIMAAVPPIVHKGYNAMEQAKGATRIEFDIVVRSQNIDLRMAPDLKTPTLRLAAIDLTDFRLEMADPNTGTIALYFSVTNPFTKDVGQFLVTNLGAHVWLRISECQQELPSAKSIADKIIERLPEIDAEMKRKHGPGVSVTATKPKAKGARA